MPERSTDSGRREGVPEAESDDTRLVVRARAGDEKAFAELTGRYLRALEGILHGIVRDRERARDLVQDTVLRAWRNLSKYREDYRFSTWLFRIGSNLAISFLRRAQLESRYQREAALSESYAPGPLEELILKEDRERLRKALDALPARLAAVMRMRYGQELPVQEIAARMKTTPNTISILLFRARARLKEELDAE